MALLTFLSAGSVTSTLFFGIFVYVCFIVIQYVLKYKRMVKFFDSLPGYDQSQKHWIKGNTPTYTNENGIRTDQILELMKKFPKFYCVWQNALKPIVELVHPDSIKILLKTAEPKPIGFGGAYRFLIPWLGEGLLVSGGSKWARSRRLLTPAFHFDILKPYQLVYNKCTDTLLDIVDKYAESGESFELFQLISNCSFDIILQCAFSYHTDCQKDREQHSYCRAVTNVAKCIVNRGRNPLWNFDTVYSLSSDGKKFKENCEFIHNIANNVIDSRRKQLESGTEQKKKYLDFLDILLTAKDSNGEGMSTEDIRAEVDTFMFEGHDTTTSGIAWILYELAKNQHYQETCQDEIDKVTNGNDYVTWEHLPKLEFLTQCIKEGMRLHATVPIVTRETTKEFTVEGTTFPVGTHFRLNIYGVHHNNTVWENPFVYDPDRFSKENTTKMDSYAFIPFSAGPRNCIGQHFALNEEKTMISRILQRFTLSLDPEHTVTEQLALVTRAKTGLRIYAKRRN